ncbi:ammonium transporter [Breznakibacter xylanolyticus]|uniref:Ammonium transporter n=1 Tax=Breznakibacter xylanolyticus TaxID=990 RepID=A0A2W7P1V8_9BACT|nr:ammonium transporter [Breznakibacter xylanolyticus]PZX17432.1 ammonium transporter [Breznakibacter xylanolyticus]
MVLATSLVMLMTPGLAFFYGGLGNKKNILNIMMQSFVSLGLTTILWFTFGYSLCFSGTVAEGTDFFGILENFDKAFLNGITHDTIMPGKAFPEYVFFAYQMMFAIITPSLITGAFINRVTFKSYVFFLIFWQIFVYYPFVHMIWGGGILQEWGVLDFAGGIVVHATAGFAALVATIYVGKRKEGAHKPNNIPLVAIGTALLWFGWYGFNAGSELDMNGITVSAFINTDVSASFAAITWLLIEWNTGAKKPTFIGLMTGAVAGLATITPAAGYVTVGTACIIGILAAVVCYFAVEFKNYMKWDDALDVWGVHGMGGVFGTILMGLVASHAINPSIQDGVLLGGDWSLFGEEITALILAIVWASAFTWVTLIIINRFTKVKVSEEVERAGLDIHMHGEIARVI